MDLPKPQFPHLWNGGVGEKQDCGALGSAPQGLCPAPLPISSEPQSLFLDTMFTWVPHPSRVPGRTQHPVPVPLSGPPQPPAPHSAGLLCWTEGSWQLELPSLCPGWCPTQTGHRVNVWAVNEWMDKPARPTSEWVVNATPPSPTCKLSVVQQGQQELFGLQGGLGHLGFQAWLVTRV